MTTEPINWRKLNVINCEEDELGKMEDVLAKYPSILRTLELDDTGAIYGWDRHFAYADGERYDCDTPRVPVDWTGFRDAVDASLQAAGQI